MIARSQMLLVLTLWLYGVAAAEAHAPPEVRSLVLDAEGEASVLVANRGLIFRDGSEPELMCNEALALSTSQLPAVVQLDRASFLATTPSGLIATRDRGCSWQRQLAPDGARHLVQSPDLPSELWLAASTGVYASADSGSSWQLRWATAAGDYVQDILLTPAPRNVYALRGRIDGSAAAYSVLRSNGAGDRWQEHPIALQADETPSLLAVNPRTPEHVIAKATSPDGSQRERLLISRDGANTFDSPLSLYAVSAASWSDDGARAWVASEEGLFLSRDAGRTFLRVGPGELLTCVRELAGRVYTCGFFSGVVAQDQGVGVSDDGGQTFARWLLYRDVTEPLSCQADAESARSCELPWRDWQSELGISPLPSEPVDSGAGTPHASRSSGCAAVPSPRERCARPTVLLLLLLTAARLTRSARKQLREPPAKLTRCGVLVRSGRAPHGIAEDRVAQ